VIVKASDRKRGEMTTDSQTRRASDCVMGARENQTLVNIRLIISDKNGATSSKLAIFDNNSHSQQFEIADNNALILQC